MSQKSFILYHDYSKLINKLNDTQLAQLVRAIFHYEITGELLELDALSDMAMTTIKLNLDRNREKYEKIVKKRIDAGSKGGKQKQANASKSKQVLASASKCKQNLANVAVNENVNVNVNVNDNEISKEKYKKESLPVSEIKNCFNKILTAYPGKRNKDYAFECFKKAIKKEKPKSVHMLIKFTSRCLNAIEAQTQEKQIKSQSGRFVPEWKNLSTWINQACWNDDVDLRINQQPANQQKPKTAGQRNSEVMDWLIEEEKKEQEKKNAARKIISD